MKTIALSLIESLARGSRKLNAQSFEQIKFFVSTQYNDGAFLDKANNRDPYYTLFGLLDSIVLDCLPSRSEVKIYLQQLQITVLPPIEYAAVKLSMQLLNYSAIGSSILLKISSFSPILSFSDSSFHVIAEDTPYSLFLKVSNCTKDQMTELQIASILQQLFLYITPQGGYSNIIGHKRATTNATAAALSLLILLEQPTDEAVSWLKSMQQRDGGFLSSEMAPIADLLSTATALFALHLCNEKPIVDSASFVVSHWLDNGGFSSTLLDEDSDVEYVFYGLLALGALSK